MTPDDIKKYIRFIADWAPAPSLALPEVYGVKEKPAALAAVDALRRRTRPNFFEGAQHGVLQGRHAGAVARE